MNAPKRAPLLESPDLYMQLGRDLAASDDPDMQFIGRGLIAFTPKLALFVSTEIACGTPPARIRAGLKSLAEIIRDAADAPTEARNWS